MRFRQQEVESVSVSRYGCGCITMLTPLTLASRTSTFVVELFPLTAADAISISVMIPGAPGAPNGVNRYVPGPRPVSRNVPSARVVRLATRTCNVP